MSLTLGGKIMETLPSFSAFDRHFPPLDGSLPFDGPKEALKQVRLCDAAATHRYHHSLNEWRLLIRRWRQRVAATVSPTDTCACDSHSN
jgi:hypothetical protein